MTKEQSASVAEEALHRIEKDHDVAMALLEELRARRRESVFRWQDSKQYRKKGYDSPFILTPMWLWDMFKAAKDRIEF